MTYKYIAVIPAYEPDEVLISLTENLQKAGVIPVVVDDGSGEAYTEIFLRIYADAVILTHPGNLGKGAALKTAFRYIKERFSGNIVVITMDCDGQHTVADALRLAAEAEKNPDALILGSRHQSKASPLRSRFGNAVTRLVYRFTSGTYVYDTQTGLRAFTGRLLPEMLTIEGDRYEYEMNVLLRLPREKVRLKEIPIETIYVDNNRGSHFNTVKDSFRIYKEILKFSASSFAGFLTDYSLFTILSYLTGSLPWGLVFSNVAARIVSAGLNFTLNRIFVFHSKDHVLKSAVQYFLLAACILCGNTLLLRFLVNQVGVNRYIAKLFTELIFFTLSWTAQRFLIFRKKEVPSSC